MKLQLTKLPLALLALSLPAQLVSAEPDKKVAEQQNLELKNQATSVKTLRAALAEAEAALKATKLKTQEKSKDKTSKHSSLIQSSVVVIGPDGKPLVIESKDGATPDIKDLLLMIEGSNFQWDEGRQKLSIKGAGSVKIVAPDGKVTEKKFDDFQIESKLDVLFDANDNKLMAELLGIGPAVLVEPNGNITATGEIATLRSYLEDLKKETSKHQESYDKQRDSLLKEVEKAWKNSPSPKETETAKLKKEVIGLKKELTEQRALLEKILSKLD